MSTTQCNDDLPVFGKGEHFCARRGMPLCVCSGRKLPVVPPHCSGRHFAFNEEFVWDTSSLIRANESDIMLRASGKHRDGERYEL